MQKLNNHKEVTSQEELIKNLMETPTVFDDMIPEPIRVSLVEFISYEVDVEGVIVTRRKPIIRVAEINTYVPLIILNKMMASQEKLKKLQALRAKQGDSDSELQQETMQWMTEQVTEVWKLTEPDMTVQKLAEGLDFKKILGLFNRFFGSLLVGLNK